MSYKSVLHKYFCEDGQEQHMTKGTTRQPTFTATLDSRDVRSPASTDTEERVDGFYYV